ncbi:MAG: hypothetical protein EZS28_023029, partial [Streblomastix strix]
MQQEEAVEDTPAPEEQANLIQQSSLKKKMDEDERVFLALLYALGGSFQPSTESQHRSMSYGSA